MTEAAASASSPAGTNGATPPSAGPAASPGADSPEAPVNGNGGSAPQLAQRPEFFPESYWDADKGEPKLQAFVDDWKGLSARVGEFDAARATIPEKAEGYELKLPEKFEKPEGLDFVLDEKNEALAPVFAKAKEWAHAAGLNQEQFSGAVALMAEKEFADHAALKAASAAEMKSLGANGTARVDAVSRFLTGHLGEPLAKALLGTLFTKAQVEAYEKLADVLKSRGVPAPKAGGEPGGGGGATDVTALDSITSGPARIAAAMAMTKPQK